MNKTLVIAAWLSLSCLLAVAQEIKTNQTDSKGLKQGYWEEKAPTGATKGNYVNDQKDGNWISYGANGNLIRIESYSQGLRNGIYVEIDQRGYLVAEMYYVNDLIEGVAKRFYYGTNPASVIEYRHGKINGKKKVYYENSAGKLTEESDYKDDVKDGRSLFYAINGDPVADYTYKNGSLEGIQKTYYPGKKLMSEQNYVNNVESGIYNEYYENGKMKVQGSYKDGKMDGKWSEFYEDGKLKSEGAYANGSKEGKWSEYDPSGKLLKSSKFVNGVEKQ